MSSQQTIEQMRELRLNGMADAFAHQLSDPMFMDVGTEARVQMLVEAEMAQRENSRYQRLLRAAKLGDPGAAPEQIDYLPGRNLDKAMVADLLNGSWIHHSRNLVITGATGTGKTFLACAIAVRAARSGHTIAYARLQNLVEALTLASGTGQMIKARSWFTRPKLLIIDDFGLVALTELGKTELFEILERRRDLSTIITGQLPFSKWYNYIDMPAVADAFMDRMKYSSQKIELKGESMRKLRAAKAA